MDFALLDFPRPWRELLEEPLPPDAYIPIKKITGYLLVRKPKDDKSSYLALAGFWPSNAEALVAALDDFCLTADVEFVGENHHGLYYQAIGILRGPNGRNLWIKTIWMKESLPGRLRLITIAPFPSPSIQ